MKQLKEKEKKVFGGIFAKPGLYDDVKTQEIKPEVKKIESESEEEEEKPIEEEPSKPAEPMEEETPVESEPAKEGEHLKSE